MHTLTHDYKRTCIGYTYEITDTDSGRTTFHYYDAFGKNKQLSRVHSGEQQHQKSKMAEETSTSTALKIAGAVILPNLGGIVNGKLTRNNLKNWYANLNFPSFRPPNWVFAPVWTTLYAGMGFGSYLVWRDGGGFSGDAQLPLVAYGTQLALNWAWTPIFFGKHSIKGGLIDIVALTAAAGACGVLFYRVNKTAGLIFVPYMAWLGFATALNYAMWKLNPEKKDEKPAIEQKLN